MHGERLARTHMGYASQSLQNNGQVGLSCMVRRHVPPSTFDHGWESMCSASKAVYRVRTCMVGGQLPYLPTAPPSIPRVMMPPTERFGIWGSGERLSELATSTSQGGENPCWWGHPLTKGQSDLGLIEWGQRGGRRWPHRVQLSPPLHFGVGFRHH